MIKNQDPGLTKFLIRVGVALTAVVLVMYLAKIWFIDQRQALVSKQTYTFVNESQQPSGTLQIIPWQDASKHYGQYSTVEGRIVATHNSGNACFLNFHPDYRRYFTAVIFASAFSRFPANPENYYYGKKVRVSGYIKEYEGGPEIILNNPDQIEILER